MARKPHLPDFSKIATTVVASAEKSLHDTVKAFAVAEKDAFVERIRAQKFKDFKAFPLSASTQERKRRLGLPLLTMIATSTYLKAIDVHEQKKVSSTTTTQIVVGIDPSLPSKDAETGRMRPEVPLADVARIHEYGAPKAKIPARRHWGPHFDDMVKRAKPVRKRVMEEVMAAWVKATAQR